MTGERIIPAMLALAERLPGRAVLIQLAFWSSAVGDLLCWGDLNPNDLILHPLQSVRAIIRAITDDASTMLLFLFYGVVIVVPVWILLSFGGRHRARSGACLSAKPQPASEASATSRSRGT